LVILAAYAVYATPIIKDGGPLLLVTPPTNYK